ncbi:type IV pilus biogenesis protein PilP [Xanthomonas sacchari]|uniref:type IV pilus biogenesis protein PilP n=1 Tax=Xanthomonas sacchari TaxID=56458 RepID=UPI002784AD84|nr:type IV pilus biogenesis protein PilP [Xanthomonas sacchari]MDQ1090589.1 type IV pilus biogenesis protein PilP [Xanthomonas sacchari]
MFGRTTPLAWLTLALMMANAQAQDTSPTIGELSKIQAQTLVLKARALQAKAQSELTGDTGKASSVVTTEPSVAPVVSRVYGVGEKLKARFLYEGGSFADEVAGALIPGDYRVISISMERVVVERNGKRQELAFSGTPPVGSKQKEQSQPSPFTYPSMTPLPRAGGLQ